MTVVFIDDHPLVGLAMVARLASLGIEAESIVPEDQDHAVRSACDFDPSLIIVDLAMPSIDDTSALVADLVSTAPVLVLSGSDDHFALGRCVAAGALAVLSKDEPVESILAEIECALRTGDVRPTVRTQRLVEFDRDCRERDAVMGMIVGLSPAERLVLAGLIDGQSAARIAEDRFVSLATTRSQIKSILTKFGVGSQLEAVSLANRVIQRYPETARLLVPEPAERVTTAI